MVIVKTKYKPVPFLPFFLTWRGIVPSHPSELTQKNLISIARYNLYILTDRGFYCQICNIPRRVAKYLSDFELFKLSQHISVHDTSAPTSVFIIKSVKCGRYSIILPSDKLENVTAGRFFMFDSLYMETSSGKREAIDNFISHLVTCKHRRKNLDQKDILNIIRKLKPEVKQAILLNYSMVRQWMTKGYPYIFVKSEKSEKNSKPGKKNSNWLPVYDSLIFQNPSGYKEIENMPLSTMLRFINEKIKNSYKHG